MERTFVLIPLQTMFLGLASCFLFPQAGFWSIFSSNLGVSASTGYNWQSVSASAQAEETTTTIGMTVIITYYVGY